MKLKWPSTGRLRRTVLMLGVAGATVGGILIAAAPAEALVGTDATPGTLELAGAANPSTGSLSATPTWSTTDGCPSTADASAVLEEVNMGAGPTYVSIAILNGPGPNPITTTETGAIGDTVGNFLADASVPNGTPDEWVVECDSLASGAAGGTTILYQDVYVTENTTAGTYSTSVPTPAVTTTTTMSASPNPATSGQAVTLTATVNAANSSAVTGSVTFMIGTTVVNSTPATVACTTATPPVCTASYTIAGGLSATTSFTAVFTPTGNYSGSSSAAYQENVNSSSTTTAGTVGVSVTITATGSLTVSIPTSTAVLTPNTAETSATGNLGTVTVMDTYNTVPGFAVYGQEVANFTGSGLPPGVTSASIPNTDLGWQPAGAVQGGATLGPSSANIGTAPAVLVQALAGAGFGTDTVNPTLTLTLPAGQPTGTYTGGVVITYISVAP